MDKRIIITIGRQFGSGGRELGKKLADRLEIDYYDKEILKTASDMSGLSREFMEEQDENAMNSLLYSFVMGTRVLNGRLSLEEMAYKAQRDALMEVAKKGSCVIVGRSADYILRKDVDLFRVFVSSDTDDRIDRVMKRDGLSHEEASKKIEKMDKQRASYYKMHTDRTWGHASNYDLCVNLSTLGLDNVVEQIVAFISRR